MTDKHRVSIWKNSCRVIGMCDLFTYVHIYVRMFDCMRADFVQLVRNSCIFHTHTSKHRQTDPKQAEQRKYLSLCIQI